MKRIAIVVFVIGLLALGGVLGLRLTGLASGTAALDVAPGEGRLDQPSDNFSGLFRSWALGGRETSTPAQDEAIMRLGQERGSRLIRLELRRLELEKLIVEAQAKLAQVRAAAPVPAAPAAEEPATASESIWDENASASEYGEGDTGSDYIEGDYSEDAGGDFNSEAPAVSPEEEEAAQNLVKLQEEYDRLLSELDPGALAGEKRKLAEIALLEGGAARGMQTLLARWGQPYGLVAPGAGLSGIAKEKPVLIVASGALKRGMRGQLNAYVKSGGTLICLAQKSGAELGWLPGHPKGFGWGEAESGLKDSVEVALAHPSTAACTAPRFAAAVDGFFTEIPANAEVLLRATGSGRPVAITYPLGKGRVVATTLYTDWEILSREPEEFEGRFLRDLVLWSVELGRGWRTALGRPGEKVEISLPIVNQTDKMAAKVRVVFLTPSGAFGKPFDLDRRILPREKDDRPFRVTVPKTNGIWHLAYALVAQDGSVLQYWRNGCDLISAAPAVAPARTRFGAALTSEGELLSVGKSINLTLNIWNHANAQMAIRVTTPAESFNLTLPANGKLKRVCRLPVTQQGKARGYFEFDLASGDVQVHLLKTVITMPAKGRGEAQ